MQVRVHLGAQRRRHVVDLFGQVLAIAAQAPHRGIETHERVEMAEGIALHPRGFERPARGEDLMVAYRLAHPLVVPWGGVVSEVVEPSRGARGARRRGEREYPQARSVPYAEARGPRTSPSETPAL